MCYQVGPTDEHRAMGNGDYSWGEGDNVLPGQGYLTVLAGELWHSDRWVSYGTAIGR